MIKAPFHPSRQYDCLAGKQLRSSIDLDIHTRVPSLEFLRVLVLMSFKDLKLKSSLKYFIKGKKLHNLWINETSFSFLAIILGKN